MATSPSSRSRLITGSSGPAASPARHCSSMPSVASNSASRAASSSSRGLCRTSRWSRRATSALSAGPVGHQRPYGRVEGDAQQVEIVGVGIGAGQGEQRPGGPVEAHDPVGAIDDHHRERLVVGGHGVDGGPERALQQCVDAGLGIAGGEPGRSQELVAVAQRHIEGLGQRQHHLDARPRPGRLEEAEVASRHLGGERQVELAHPPLTAPVLEQRREDPFAGVAGRRDVCGGSGHDCERRSTVPAGHLPRQVVARRRPLP